MKLSKSKINTYKKCPREFKYIYVDGRESPPNDYMQLGLDVHKNAENIGRYLKDLDDITKDDVLKAFEECYVESRFDITEHMASLFDFFVDVFVDGNYCIVDVEDNIFDEDINVRGIVDLVLEDPDTKELIVIDYKTSKSKAITNYRLELCIYKKLVESKYEGRTVSSACIFFTKDGKYRGFNFAEEQSKGAYVTQEDYNTVFDYINYVKNKIDTKKFPPKKQFLCKYCNFIDECDQDGGF